MWRMSVQGTSEGQHGADTEKKQQKNKRLDRWSADDDLLMIHWFLPLAGVHEIKSLIDLLKGQRVGDKLIHLQLLAQVFFDQFRDAFHALPPCGQTLEASYAWCCCFFFLGKTNELEGGQLFHNRPWGSNYSPPQPPPKNERAAHAFKLKRKAWGVFHKTASSIHT